MLTELMYKCLLLIINTEIAKNVNNVQMWYN